MLGSAGQGKKRFISLILCMLMALSLMPDIPASITPVAEAENIVEEVDTGTEPPAQTETVVVASEPVNAANLLGTYDFAPANASQYTVTYIVGTSTYDTETVDAESLASGPSKGDPTDPRGSNHPFVGWYASGSTEPFDFLSQPIMGNLTLTAQFSQSGVLQFRNPHDGYKIIHVMNVPQGTTPSEPSFTSTELKLPDNTELEYWYVEGGSDSANFFTGSPTVTGLVTLTPKLRGLYMVAFSSEGGSIVDPVLVNSGDPVPQPASPTRNGYEFQYWSVAPGTMEETTPYNFSAAVNNSFTLYAVWKPTAMVGFRLAYYYKPSNDTAYYSFLAVDVEDADYALIGTVLDSATIERLAAEYKQDAIDARGSNNNYLTYTTYSHHSDPAPLDITGSTTITVYYDLIDYTVVYDLTTNLPDGLSASDVYLEHNGSTYQYDQYSFTAWFGRAMTAGVYEPYVTNVTAPGYVVRYWVNEAGSRVTFGNQFTNTLTLPLPPNEPVTKLYPKWEKEEDTLLVEYNRYLEVGELELEKLDISLVKNINDIDFSDGFPAYLAYEDQGVIRYTYLSPNYYFTEYILKSQIGAYEAYRVPLFHLDDDENPTKGNRFQFSMRGNCTVYFNAGAGTHEVAENEIWYVRHGYRYPRPLPVVKPLDGYDFVGWYSNPNGTGSRLENQPNAVTPWVGVMYWYAIYKPQTNEKDINFYADTGNGSERIHTTVVPTGQSMQNTATATYPTGYPSVADPSFEMPGMGTFNGWVYSSLGTNVTFLPSTPVNNTLDLYASWQEVTYDVTFKYYPTDLDAYAMRYVVSGANNSISFTGTLGTGVANIDEARRLPNAPTPPETGMVFAGWFTAPNGGGDQFTAGTRVLADITVYAHFTEGSAVLIEYEANPSAMGTVALNPDGAAAALVSEPVAPINGDPVGAKAVANPGYRFTGWTLNGNPVTSTDGVLVPSRAAGEIWTARKYVANFEALSPVKLTYQTLNLSNEMGVLDIIGTVSQGVETVETITNPATGSPVGTTAHPKSGYKFVKWTLLDGTLIAGEDSATLPLDKLIRDEAGNLLERTYVAHFASMGSVTLKYETSSATMGQVTDVNNPASEVNNTSETINPATGSPKPVTAKPKPGYRFVNWTVDGNEVSTNAAIQQSELLNGVGSYIDATYIANFTQEDEVTINFQVNPAGMGSIAPAYSQTLRPATGVATEVTASATTGHEFVNWTLGVGGSVVSTTPDFTPTKAAGAVWLPGTTYVANFKPMDQISITYKANNPLYGMVTDASGVTESSEITYQINPESGTPRASTAKPANGYRFINWTGPDGIVSTSATLLDTDIPRNANNLYETATYTANFALLDSVTLTYETKDRDATMGQVTDVDTPTSLVTSTSETINPKTGVPKRSTAVPKPGYKFDGWYIGDVDWATAETIPLASLVGHGTSPDYKTTTYTARFSEQDPVTIAFQPNNAAWGSIEGTTPQSVRPATGEVSQVTAKPADGYEFVEWRLGSATGPVVSGAVATFKPTKAAGTIWDDRVYVAVFKEMDRITITYESSNSTRGLVSNVTTGTNVPSASQTINPMTGSPNGSTATAEPGFRFIRWTGPGGFSSDDPVLSPTQIARNDVTNLYENATYTAIFESQTNVTLKYTSADPDKGQVTEVGGTAQVPTTSESINPQTGTPRRSTAVPKAGYVFAGWTYEGSSVSASETILDADLERDGQTGYYIEAEYLATFTEAPNVTIRYQSSNNAWGTASVTGAAGTASEPVPPATGQPMGGTAVEKPGYEFISWTLGGVEVSRELAFVPEKADDAIWTNRTYIANFAERKPVTITYQSNDAALGTVTDVVTGLGTGSTSEQINPENGTPTGATAAETSGNRFVRWTLGGAEISTQRELLSGQITKVGDYYTTRTYVAHFEPLANVTLTYRTDDPDMGMVTDVNSPATEVRSTSDSLNPQTGTAKPTTAKPKPGYRFVEWQVNGSGVSTNPAILDSELRRENGGYAAAEYVAIFEELPAVTVQYRSADTTMGTVTPASEANVKPATGVLATGSTATEKAGYEFTNWTLGLGGVVVGEDPHVVPARQPGQIFTNETTYYANFRTKGEVTIQYKLANPDHGTLSPRYTESLLPSAASAQGTTATNATGYTFDYWEDDRTPSNRYDTATLVPQKVNGEFINITYTAYFKENTATISYDVGLGGGGSVSPETEGPFGVVTGGFTGSVPTPETGYRFEKWTTSNNPVGGAELAVVTGNRLIPPTEANGLYATRTYYAHFVQTDNVTLTYKVNDDLAGTLSPRSSESVRPVDGDPLGTTAFANPGYDFIGWTDPNGTVVDTAAAQLVLRKADDTIWTPQTYTANFTEKDNIRINYVSINDDHGTVDRAQDDVAPATGTAQGSTATAKAGYIFSHWTRSNGEIIEPRTEKLTPDKVNGLNVADTYTAHFTQKTVTHTYLVGTASAGMGSVTPGSQTNLLAATGVATGSTPRAKNAGYEFVGWTTDAEGNNPILTAADGVDENNNYKLTPEKVAGEYVNGTWYAHFKQKAAVTIYYETEDVSKGYVSRTSEQVLPATGVPQGATATNLGGFVFSNWTGTDGTNTADNAPFRPTKLDDEVWVDGTTYTAHFVEEGNVSIRYQVADPRHGYVNPTQESVPPSSVDAKGSTAYNHPGFTFSRWTNSDGVTVGTTGVASFIPDRVNDLNVPGAYTAHFTENQVRIEYKVGTGSAGMGSVTRTSETVGAALGTPQGSAPTLTAGYEFDKWTMDDAGLGDALDVADGNLFVPETEGTDNLLVARTYYAHFKEKAPVTLTYVSSDPVMGYIDPARSSEQILPVSVNTAQGSEAFENNGYRFVSWTLLDGTFVSNDREFAPTKAASAEWQATTFRANFVEKADVLITYESEDTAKGTVTPGSELKAPATGTFTGSTATEKPGYTFKDWIIKDTDTVVGTARPFVPRRNTLTGIYEPAAYVARFTENEVTVRYLVGNGNGGSVSLPNETIGAATGIPKGATTGEPTGSVPSNDPGYRFVKWTTNADPNGPEASLPTRSGDHLMPQRGTDGLYQETIYYAHFEQSDNVTLRYVVATGQSQMGSVLPTTNSVAPALGVPEGSEAKANPGYSFVEWAWPDGVKTTIAETVKPTRATAGVDIWTDGMTWTANFEENPNVLITYASEDEDKGTVTNSGITDSVPPATGTALGSTATAKPGYTFSHWENNNRDEVSKTARLTPPKNANGLNVSDDYTAIFTEDKATFTFDVGTASAAFGDVFPKTPAAIGAATGTAPTAVPAPAEGYEFAKWTTDAAGLSATVTDGVDPLTGEFTPQRNAQGIYVSQSYYVHYVQKANVTLYYESADPVMGTVSPASNSVAPATGAPLGASATAKDGYHFTGWTVETTGVAAGPNANNEKNFIPTKDGAVWVDGTTYVANFAEDGKVPLQYVSANTAEGTVSPPQESVDPATGIPNGSTATAKDGYAFSHWTHNGIEYTLGVTTDPDGKTSTIVPEKVLNAAWTKDQTWIAHFEELDDVLIEYKVADTPGETRGTVFPIQELVAPVTEDAAGSLATAADGYHFSHWTDESGNTVEALNPHYTPARQGGLNVATTYYAHFEEDSVVAIRYRSYDTTMGRVDPGIESVRPATGDPAGSDAIPLTGYKFSHWTNEAGDTVNDTDPHYIPSRSDVDNLHYAQIYTAHFEELDPVTIRYTVSDEKMGSVTPRSQTLLPSTGVLEGSTASYNPGYRFVNWVDADDNEVGIDPYFAPARVSGLHVAATYRAMYRELDPVTMNYGVNDTDAGQVTDTQTGQQADSTTESMNPEIGKPVGSKAITKPGYEFVNWTAGNTEVTKSATLQPTDLLKDANGAYIDADYTANYVELPAVKIEYRPDDPAHGTVTPTEENPKPATGIALGSTAEEKAGYAFSKWINNVGMKVSEEETLIPVTDANGLNFAQVYTAVFDELPNVTITYSVNDPDMGSVYPTRESKAPATGTVTGSTASQKAGYTFLHWEDENGDIVSQDAKFVPERAANGLNVSAEYTAVFEELPDIAIRYVSDDTTKGTVSRAREEVAPATGTPLGSQAIPAAGYQVSHWINSDGDRVSTDIHLTPERVKGLNVEETYTAVFVEKANVTISYKSANSSHGSVSPNSESVAPVTGTAQGATATASGGYTFKNWTDSTGNEVGTDVKFTPAKISGLNAEATYTANFTENQVTHTFAVGTGSGTVNPASQTLGAVTGTATGSTPTAASGYRFVKWTESADGSGASVAVSGGNRVTPQKEGGLHVDRTYYAHFELIPVPSPTPTATGGGGGGGTPTPRPTTAPTSRPGGGGGGSTGSTPTSSGRQAAVGGVYYTIAENDVPLAGIGSRNMGDCAY